MICHQTNNGSSHEYCAMTNVVDYQAPPSPSHKGSVSTHFLPKILVRCKRKKEQWTVVGKKEQSHPSAQVRYHTGNGFLCLSFLHWFFWPLLFPSLTLPSHGWMNDWECATFLSGDVCFLLLRKTLWRAERTNKISVSSWLLSLKLRCLSQELFLSIIIMHNFPQLCMPIHCI